MDKIQFCNNQKAAHIPDGWKVLLWEDHRSSKHAYTVTNKGKYNVPDVIFFSSSEPEEIPPEELDAILDQCGDVWQEYRLARANGCKFDIELLPSKEDAPDAVAWVEQQG